jgi:hypothetical protein
MAEDTTAEDTTGTTETATAVTTATATATRANSLVQDAKLQGVERQIKQIASLLETTKRSEDLLRTEIKAVREKQDNVDRLLQQSKIETGIGNKRNETPLSKLAPTAIGTSVPTQEVASNRNGITKQDRTQQPALQNIMALLTQGASILSRGSNGLGTSVPIVGGGAYRTDRHRTQTADAERVLFRNQETVSRTGAQSIVPGQQQDRQQQQVATPLPLEKPNIGGYQEVSKTRTDFPVAVPKEKQPPRPQAVRLGGTGSKMSDAFSFAKDQLRKEGVPEGNLDAAAAHLVGQAHMESGLNPKATHDYVNGTPTGAGIYGARLKRKDAMLDWLDKNKFSKDSLEGQTRYMAHEAMTKYPRTANILRNATPQTFERDTPLITKNFEAPAVINYRTGAVQQAYNSRLQQQQQGEGKGGGANLVKAPSLAGQEQQTQKYSTEPVHIEDISKQAGFGHKFGDYKKVEGLVVHHTGGRGSPQGIVNVFKERGFPANFVMDRDGKVYRTLEKGARGQHILNSTGKYPGYGNKNMLGIEVIARDDSDWTDAQKKAIVPFIAQEQKQYGFDKSHVFGHGELNPGHREETEGMQGVARWRENLKETPSQQKETAPPREAQVATKTQDRIGIGTTTPKDAAAKPPVSAVSAVSKHFLDIAKSSIAPVSVTSTTREAIKEPQQQQDIRPGQIKNYAIEEKVSTKAPAMPEPAISKGEKKSDSQLLPSFLDNRTNRQTPQYHESATVHPVWKDEHLTKPKGGTSKVEKGFTKRETGPEASFEYMP